MTANRRDLTFRQLIHAPRVFWSPFALTILKKQLSGQAADRKNRNSGVPLPAKMVSKTHFRFRVAGIVLGDLLPADH